MRIAFWLLLFIYLFFFYWESNCMNLNGQTVMWSCYIPGKILSRAPENCKGNLTTNKETLFSALCAPLHRSLHGVNDQSFKRLCREFPTLGYGLNSGYTLRGHEADLSQWSIIFCVFGFDRNLSLMRCCLTFSLGLGWGPGHLYDALVLERICSTLPESAKYLSQCML